MAFWTSSLFIRWRCARPGALVLCAPSRLVPVVGILMLVTLLLFFSKLFPVVLDIITFVFPFVSDDFGYFRV
jgi:hypothetical protein